MIAPAAASASPAGAGARLSPATRFAYGAFAVPLAMGALPLYVHLPKFYGEVFGVGLAALGVLLLALRAGDALLDPLLGAWSDRGPTRKRLIAWSAPVLAFGMVALFVPQVRGEGPLLAWIACSLAIVYVAYSLATINHNAWGAELSSDPDERTRITATREGLALAALHAARLLAVVCAVAVLLERLSLQRLVGGLHALSRPLRVIGVPPERLALRLLLVLRYVEASPRGHGRAQWRDWLLPELDDDKRDGGERDDGAEEVVVLIRERLGVLDASVALGVFAALLWWSLA